MGLNKDEAVKKITDSGEESFEVFTGPEHTEYLDNYAKGEVESRIGAEISKVHTQYDDDMFELTGKRKDGSEKTYDFIKREVKALKELGGNSETLKDKIKELEDDLKNKSGDEQLKKDYANLKELYNTDKATWDKKTQDFITKQDLMKIEIQLDNATTGLKFKEEIPKSVRDVMIKNAVSKLVSQGKIAENQLIFLDSEGKTALNKENNLNPYTAEEMMTKELKEILGESKTITKPNTKPEIKTDGEGKKTISVYIPDGVRTKEGVTRHLMSLGLDRNSEEYQLAYKEYSKDLPHE